MAIAALVVGIVSCCGVLFVWGGFLGIVALVLGVVALNQVKREPTAYKPASKGMAVAGIVIGAVALLASVLMLAILVPMIIEYCEEHPEVEGCGNLVGASPSMAAGPFPPTALASVPLVARSSKAPPFRAPRMHGPRDP